MNIFSAGGSSAASVISPLQTRVGGPLSQDAWGRPKSVIDKSLIHAMFTASIPREMWKETINGIETDQYTAFTNAVSNSGLANISAGATLNDVTILDTLRSPRYEPNRGHLYSSSIILPSPTAAGRRDFGMFTEENGAFFRLKSDGFLYACRRTTHNGDGTSVIEQQINPILIAMHGIDLAKGNIYDIQMQWRGVGNISYFIGSVEKGYSVEIHKMGILGTLEGLSIANPSLPIAYVCENLGANVVIQSGCADITSEGGVDENHLYGSISIDNEAGQVASSGFNTPILVVRNKKVVNTLRNVRDNQALSISGYSDQKSILRVWATRDETAITLNDQVWRDYGDGFLEYLQYDNPDVATPMTFDTAKADLVYGARVPQDGTFVSPATFEGKTEVHQSPGDIFIFTLHRESGTAQIGGVTYEFGQEI